MEKKKVFMIMPFKDEYFEVYEMLKMNFADDFIFSNAGDESNQQNILKDIIQPIYEADIIIADLTGLNANVMYELGIAHTFNKKTIVITQDDLSTLPFDLKQYRAKDYSTHFKKFAELIDYLKENLYGAVKGTVSYSNPVKDFLTIEKIEQVSWFSDKVTIELEDESDKGFIDFLADIEADKNNLTVAIKNLSQDIREMNSGLTTSVNEIKRVNKNGGSGTAAFVRKESRKVAKYLDTFGEKLRGHNKTMEELWNKIEKNSLGLLENRFATKDKNKKGLVSYLVSLFKLKGSISESNNAVEKLKSAFEENLGLERSMNQAIRFVVADLATHITISERIQSSIEKILSKAKYVVGEINYENS